MSTEKSNPFLRAEKIINRVGVIFTLIMMVFILVVLPIVMAVSGVPLWQALMPIWTTALFLGLLWGAIILAVKWERAKLRWEDRQSEDVRPPKPPKAVKNGGIGVSKNG
ncbi:membrane protein [Microbacterium phage Pumpernickel]|uniref:Membrane protein n=1 Tax=Microbacterium phage Pumpernickel TaxID=2885983 RepID=A0AAE9C3K3_9CAUD|nr:membrane protein [Microbacterium phage Pumpernickel]UDL16046.1 membrane protein [Microbacterium phage Pumpernickel]